MTIRDMFIRTKCEFHFSRLHVNKINNFCSQITDVSRDPIEKYAIQSKTITRRPKIHAHPLLLILSAKTDVFLRKMRIKVFKFLLSL